MGLVLVIMMFKVSNTMSTAKLPKLLGKTPFLWVCGGLVGLWAKALRDLGGHLGGMLGKFGVTLGILGSMLGALGGHVGNNGVHLGLAWASRRIRWAIPGHVLASSSGGYD